MSIPVNIRELINARTVESNRIEFKSDFNPAPIIRTICAFANDIDNTGGGYIIIGVEESNGVPVLPAKGVEQSRIDGILRKLREYCHYIEPLYEPVVEPIPFEEKLLIVIWVPGGHGRPYKAPKDVLVKGSEKHYYIRKFSSTEIASREEEGDLFYVSSNIPFDDRENLVADVSDLDIGIMRDFLKEVDSDLYRNSEGRSTLELAWDMQLVGGPEENVKPLNVGILMFSEHPEKHFRYARIEVVDIPDPTGNGMVEKMFTGPIQRQLKDALSFIRNYVIKEVTIKEDDRAEARRFSNYPFRAVEEILANAVYHRSYQINEPITVRITPQAMEITSFPGFDRSISDSAIEGFEIRSRFYRNRRIGDFLKELKLIEGRNTGFPNALNALKANGSEMPRFTMDGERSYLSVTIPIHPYFLSGRRRSSDEEYENRIRKALGKKPLSLTELAVQMGYRGITKKLSGKIKEMESLGSIRRVVSDDSSVKLQLSN